MLHGISWLKNSSFSYCFHFYLFESLWFQLWGWLNWVGQLWGAVCRVCCLYFYYLGCQWYYRLQIRWCRLEINIHRWRVLHANTRLDHWSKPQDHSPSPPKT